MLFCSGFKALNPQSSGSLLFATHFLRSILALLTGKREKTQNYSQQDCNDAGRFPEHSRSLGATSDPELSHSSVAHPRPRAAFTVLSCMPRVLRRGTVVGFERCLCNFPKASFAYGFPGTGVNCCPSLCAVRGQVTFSPVHQGSRPTGGHSFPTPRLVRPRWQLEIGLGGSASMVMGQH